MKDVVHKNPQLVMPIYSKIKLVRVRHNTIQAILKFQKLIYHLEKSVLHLIKNKILVFPLQKKNCSLKSNCHSAKIKKNSKTCYLKILLVCSKINLLNSSFWIPKQQIVSYANILNHSKYLLFKLVSWTLRVHCYRLTTKF